LTLKIYGVLAAIQGFELPSALSGWTAIILCALFSTVFGIICLFEKFVLAIDQQPEFLMKQRLLMK